MNPTRLCCQQGGRLLLLAVFLGLPLLGTGCHSLRVSPVSQASGDLEHSYRDEANAENEFDPGYVASTHNDQGDFYPVSWLARAQQASGGFWEQMEEYQAKHGAREMVTLLNRLVQRHGFCMLMATSDAQRVLGEEMFAQTLHNATGAPQTRLFHYIYFGPGNALVQTSSTFASLVP